MLDPDMLGRWEREVGPVPDGVREVHMAVEWQGKRIGNFTPGCHK